MVEPAQPPTNIKKRKKINGNFPHNPKSSVTYPVPDKIERTLKDDILRLSKKDNSLLFKNKYKNIISIDIISKNPIMDKDELRKIRKDILNMGKVEL